MNAVLLFVGPNLQRKKDPHADAHACLSRYHAEAVLMRSKAKVGAHPGVEVLRERSGDDAAPARLAASTFQPWPLPALARAKSHS